LWVLELGWFLQKNFLFPLTNLEKANGIPSREANQFPSLSELLPILGIRGFLVPFLLSGL
jgi:hypothetical protein